MNQNGSKQTHIVNIGRINKRIKEFDKKDQQLLKSKAKSHQPKFQIIENSLIEDYYDVPSPDQILLNARASVNNSLNMSFIPNPMISKTPGLPRCSFLSEFSKRYSQAIYDKPRLGDEIKEMLDEDDDLNNSSSSSEKILGSSEKIFGKQSLLSRSLKHKLPIIPKKIEASNESLYFAGYFDTKKPLMSLKELKTDMHEKKKQLPRLWQKTMKKTSSNLKEAEILLNHSQEVQKQITEMNSYLEPYLSELKKKISCFRPISKMTNNPFQHVHLEKNKNLIDKIKSGLGNAYKEDQRQN